MGVISRELADAQDETDEGAGTDADTGEPDALVDPFLDPFETEQWEIDRETVKDVGIVLSTTKYLIP